MGGLWLSAALTKCGYKVLVLEQFLGGDKVYIYIYIYIDR